MAATTPPRRCRRRSCWPGGAARSSSSRTWRGAPPAGWSRSRRQGGIMAEQPLGTVLVTGGASGLGAATVGAVAAAGGRALVLDRVPPPDGVPAADFEPVDLADAPAAQAAVRAI